MSLLKHEELQETLRAGDPHRRLVVTPLLDPDTQIGEASIDLRLSTEFIEVRRRAEAFYDPFAREPIQAESKETRETQGENPPSVREGVGEEPEDSYAKVARRLEAREEEIVVPLGDRLTLHPGQFMLGATFEFVSMPTTMGGQVLGRSSWGRVGLIVATAVVVQPGFKGCLTLELQNIGSVPIYLYPGVRIAQLQVWRMHGATEKAYSEKGGKYRIPLGPQGTRIGWEMKERDRIFYMGERLRGVPRRPSPQQDEEQKGEAPPRRSIS